MIYKQGVTHCDPKVYPHTKFVISIANNIGDEPEVKVKVTPKQYRALWRKFRVPTSKRYKIYALDTIYLELGSEDQVKITVALKQYETLCDPNVYPHTKFGIPASNYITDMLRTRLRFRLTDGQIISCGSGLHEAHHHLWL